MMFHTSAHAIASALMMPRQSQIRSAGEIIVVQDNFDYPSQFRSHLPKVRKTDHTYISPHMINWTCVTLLVVGMLQCSALDVLLGGKKNSIQGSYMLGEREHRLVGVNRKSSHYLHYLTSVTLISHAHPPNPSHIPYLMGGSSMSREMGAYTCSQYDLETGL